MEPDEDDGGGVAGVSGAEVALLRRRRGRPPKARLECPCCDKTASDPAYLAEHLNHWHFGKALTDKQILALKEQGVPVRLAGAWSGGHSVISKLGEGVPLVEVVRPAGSPGVVKPAAVPAVPKPPVVVPERSAAGVEPPAAGVGAPAVVPAQKAAQEAKEPAGITQGGGATSVAEGKGGLKTHPTGSDGGVVREPSLEKSLSLWREAVDTTFVFHAAKSLIERRQVESDLKPVITVDIRSEIARRIGVPLRYLVKEYARFNINAQVATLVRGGSLDATFLSRGEYRKWYPGQESRSIHAYSLPSGEVVGTRLAGRRAPGEVVVEVLEVGVDENGLPFVRLRVEAVVPTGVEKEVKVLF